MPRSAICTRKSVEEATGVSLSTIENQQAVCISYLATQDDWAPIATAYDDLGWSGGIGMGGRWRRWRGRGVICRVGSYAADMQNT